MPQQFKDDWMRFISMFWSCRFTWWSLNLAWSRCFSQTIDIDSMSSITKSTPRTSPYCKFNGWLCFSHFNWKEFVFNYHIQQSRGEPFQHTETGYGVVHHYQGTDAEQEEGHCLGFQSNVSREFHLQPYTEPTQDKTRALKGIFAELMVALSSFSGLSLTHITRLYITKIILNLLSTYESTGGPAMILCFNKWIFFSFILLLRRHGLDWFVWQSVKYVGMWSYKYSLDQMIRNWFGTCVELWESGKKLLFNVQTDTKALDFRVSLE